MTSNANDNTLEGPANTTGSTATTSARSSPKTIALFVEAGADEDGTVNALRRAYAGKA